MVPKFYTETYNPLEVVVVMVVTEVSVNSYSSSSQEMTVRLKNVIRKMNKTLFIFSSIPKLKSYWLVY